MEQDREAGIITGRLPEPTRTRWAKIYNKLWYLERTDKVVCARWFLAGLAFGAVGLFMLYFASKDYLSHRAIIEHGIETKASIFHTEKRLASGRYTLHNNYIIEFSWRDREGQERTGRSLVSREFWQRVVSGRITETPIRYLEDDAKAGSILVSNLDSVLQDDLTGICLGLIFTPLGAFCLYRFARVLKKLRGNSQNLKPA